jgi:hypothetical protein
MRRYGRPTHQFGDKRKERIAVKVCADKGVKFMSSKHLQAFVHAVVLQHCSLVKAARHIAVAVHHVLVVEAGVRVVVDDGGHDDGEEVAHGAEGGVLSDVLVPKNGHHTGKNIGGVNGVVVWYIQIPDPPKNKKY